MQQQPQQMIPMMSSSPPTNITTEQIQKFLDENKQLILAIMNNQNLGKLAECAQYQALLQKNLMYLAAIADAQPSTPAMASQMAPHPMMPQGGFYMQHPQAVAMAQQPENFPPNVPLQFNNQQVIQAAQMGLRPMGAHSIMLPPHNEATIGGGNSSGRPPTSGLTPDAGASGGDGQGSSSAGLGSSLEERKQL